MMTFYFSLLPFSLLMSNERTSGVSREVREIARNYLDGEAYLPFTSLFFLFLFNSSTCFCYLSLPSFVVCLLSITTELLKHRCVCHSVVFLVCFTSFTILFVLPTLSLSFSSKHYFNCFCPWNLVSFLFVGFFTQAWGAPGFFTNFF